MQTKLDYLVLPYQTQGQLKKILVTVPERFEASITTLENTKDLSMITLAELLNALQSQEQRRDMSRDSAIEGALPVKHHVNSRNNKNKKGKTSRLKWRINNQQQ